MLPTNIIDLLKELFSSVGFLPDEIEKKIEAIDESFANIITAKMLEKIPEDKQKKASEKLKGLKVPSEVIKALGELFTANLKKEDFNKVYREELIKILEEIFKPLRETASSEQLAKIRNLINSKYLS